YSCLIKAQKEFDVSFCPVFKEQSLVFQRLLYLIMMQPACQLLFLESLMPEAAAKIIILR
ncbi:hypothetical protein P9759_14485, partial [Heyndrickxia coagulans]|uniref:hypothetical protein n=1 Tax=Heyndrickxia coagulans TaxID=1398 RepID=UPI002E236AB3|nr:hypothetical protein [Heyndrickxia coagulans]